MERKSVYDELQRVVEESLTEEKFNASKESMLTTLKKVVKETKKQIKQLESFTYEDCQKLETYKKMAFVFDGKDGWLSTIPFFMGTFGGFNGKKGELKSE